MPITNRFGLIAAAALWAGCAGTESLRESFEMQRSTLGYVQESRENPSGGVAIAEYRVVSNLPDTTAVKRTGSLILPLVVFNSWTHRFDVKLGKEGVDPALESFGRKSLARDLERAGAKGTGGPDDVKVRVRVTEVKSGAAYARTGFFYIFLFVYGYGGNHEARDIQSSLAADIILERNGRADTVKFSHRETGLVPTDHGGSSLPEVTVNALGETLSLCFQRMHARILAEAAKLRG